MVFAFVFALPFTYQLGCHSQEITGSLEDSVSNYICQGSCEKIRLRPFLNQAVHLEIEPTGEMSQVFYNIDPKGLGTNPIILKKTARISGKAPGAEPYLAKEQKLVEHDKSAAFSDILAIPTVNKVTFLSPRIPTIRSRLGTDALFQIDLLSGLSYTLVLNPAGTNNRAPIHINPDIILDDRTLDFPVDIKLSRVFGRVISEDVTILSGDTVSLMQARVTQGTRLISSIGKVKNDGTFAIEISNPLFGDAKDQPFNLVIEPTDPETALPRIRRKLEIAQLKNDFDVGPLNLGKLKKPISVTVEIHGSDNQAIGDAFLYLSGKVGAGETLVKKQVDSSGTAKFDHLYEGPYDIAVVPPNDCKFAMKVIKAVEFDAKDKRSISIELSQRDVLKAVVYAPNGHAMSGAQFELLRVGEIGNFATEDIYDDMLFKLTANTNDYGMVCHRQFGYTTSNSNDCENLLLDEGRYLAHVIPPAGTELSHKWITFDFPKHNELSIMLDQPEVLSGQILAPDQKSPVKNAFITVYLAETNMHNQPKVIGSAMTNDQGFFKAFVSAP